MMAIDFEKVDGKISFNVKGRIEDVLVLREVLESKFDAIVRLIICTNNSMEMVISSANDGPLGQDETVILYRSWIQGFIEGRAWK